MTPIAEWLRATRERQTRADGEPWSQDDFLVELERATGWHLHRPNYSRYETGKAIPKRDTLAKLMAFWEARGEPGPDLTPPPPPVAEPSLPAVLSQMVGVQNRLLDELAALRDERQTLAEQVADLRETVASLVALHTEGSGADGAQHVLMRTRE